MGTSRPRDRAQEVWEIHDAGNDPCRRDGAELLLSVRPRQHADHETDLGALASEEVVDGVADHHHAVGRYATASGDDDAFAFANRETLVICLIEDPIGIENVEAIASQPGVDVITFGGDLSTTTGHLGDFRHPEVEKLIRDGISRARAAGKPVGLSVGASEVDRFKEYIDLGVTVVQMLPAPLICDAVARLRDALMA